MSNVERKKNYFKFIVLIFFITISAGSLFNCHCGSSATVAPSITFAEVGSSFGTSNLIDLEFLPGQNGELIVIGKDGTVYYVNSDFSPFAQTASVSVLDDGEQGLLNVAADPNYTDNKFIYLYFTSSDGSQNQVDRYTVNVDVNVGTFSIDDGQTIITFPKSESSNPGTNHNGGGLVFDDEGNLLIGVGDGGGGASADTSEGIGQNVTIRLGKLLRVVPSRDAGTGGFSIPSGGNNTLSGALPEIYSYGLRNPFTLAFGNDTVYIGDVGQSRYEEIDAATTGGQNFGWPDTEGPTTNSNFVSPLYGYDGSAADFVSEDPEAVSVGSRSIMVLNYYTGDQYLGHLSNRLIYSEFYVGFVRGLELNDSNTIIADDQLGHLTGMTSLQEGPDSFLYAVSLFGSDKILRVNLSN